MNAHDAALAAGMTRLRPVIMTALAMIIGMLPMSPGPGRGRRAERAAGPGRHRRPGRRDLRDALLRPGGLRRLRKKPPHRAVEPELQEG